MEIHRLGMPYVLRSWSFSDQYVRMNEGSTERRLGPAVAEEVRALLGRRRISGVQLAKQIGKSQPYFSRRLNGSVAFDLDDLEAIASVLDVSLADLIRKAAEGANQDFERAPAERPATIGHPFVSLPEGVSRPAVDKAPTRPNGHPKPGPNRPGSPVPPSKRRPARMKPVSR